MNKRLGVKEEELEEVLTGCTASTEMTKVKSYRRLLKWEYYGKPQIYKDRVLEWILLTVSPLFLCEKIATLKHTISPNALV